MKVITVDSLDGIPSHHQADLYGMMKTCSNGQRLAVCLYLMSDLPHARHHLGDIEREYIKIFPPSLRHHFSPQDYADFQASTIRGLFNRETKDVNEGSLTERLRLWTSPNRGHWRNTDLGNQVARQILRDNGRLVQKGEAVLNPIDEELPQVERPYMEEELAEEVRTVVVEEPEAAPISENLLAHIDRILSALPTVSFDQLPVSNGPRVSVSGAAKEVSGILRGITDLLPTNEVRLVITIGRNGYHVEVEAGCNEARPGK
jgi:hypothetical protein